MEPASAAQSPRDSSARFFRGGAEANKKGPLRVFHGRKPSGVISALAKRHPSPRTLASFVSNSSSSRIVEEQLSHAAAVIQHKRVQIKRVADSQSKPKAGLKKPSLAAKNRANEHIKELLHNSVRRIPRSNSQAGDVTELNREDNADNSRGNNSHAKIDVKRLERVKSATRLVQSHLKPRASFKDQHSQNASARASKAESAAPSPRVSSSKLVRPALKSAAPSPSHANSGSKCAIFRLTSI